MASSGNISVMGLFLVASLVAMASPGTAYRVSPEEVDSPSQLSPGPSPYSWMTVDLPISPLVRDFLLNCTKKIADGCGPQVFDYLFGGKTGVSDDCCDNLLSIGIGCHRMMTRFVAEVPEFTSKADQIHSLSEKIFSQCSGSSTSPAPSP